MKGEVYRKGHCS